MTTLALPSSVTVDTVHLNTLVVTGPLGSVRLALSTLDPDGLCWIHVHPTHVSVITHATSQRSQARVGTLTALLRQGVDGVTKGWVVSLTIHGVGFRAEKVGDCLDLKLGQSHALGIPIPEDVHIFCVKPTLVSVYGVDKQRVTQVAASIRALKPAEVYKGKGIRFLDEHVRLKEGKKK